MRKRNKVEKLTKLEKLLERQTLLILEPSDGIYPATIVEPRKEGKEKNLGIKAMKAVGYKIQQKRGVGFTKKDKSSTKTSRKAEKNSRRVNAKIAKKVFRPTGSKKRR